jgi:hypothetical protein
VQAGRDPRLVRLRRGRRLPKPPFLADKPGIVLFCRIHSPPGATACPAGRSSPAIGR